MCGIFGIATRPTKRFPSRKMRRLVDDFFRDSVSRGKEASGLAVQQDDEIAVLKGAVSAAALIETRQYAKFVDAHLGQTPRAILGHTRLVTNGAQTAGDNNHPIVKDGIVCVHNGIIVNEEALWAEHPELERRYDVDTEILATLTRHYLKAGDPLDVAASRTFERLVGTASTAMIFEDLEALLLATNNGSLYFTLCPIDGVLVFASEVLILERMCEHVKKHLAIRLPEPRRLAPGHRVVLDTRSFAITERVMSTELSVVNLATRAKPRSTRVELLETPRARSSVVEARAELRKNDPVVLEAAPQLKRCAKCVLPETMPYLELDAHGVCRYCRTRGGFPVQGAEPLRAIAQRIASRSDKVDCVVAYSGGRDSSYILHYLKRELGLNPIAYTYDWGMVTDLARRNTARLCGKLGIEHIIISADINKKRENVRKNVLAWLKKPDLGVIPLFMAGDKMFFWHADQLRKKLGVNTVFFGHNELEHEDFKVGFCGLRTEMRDAPPFFALTPQEQIRLLAYYGKEFVKNPAYLNRSLADTAFAFYCYYLMSHRFYVNFFAYIRWNEAEIVDTLKNEYDWELATDTSTSWRIGDGTAAFYNYIYQTVAGFSEHDSFRSNQVRDGSLTRSQALELVEREGRARSESLREYCELINIDYVETMRVIHSIPKLYHPSLVQDPRLLPTMDAFTGSTPNMSVPTDLRKESDRHRRIV